MIKKIAKAVVRASHLAQHRLHQGYASRPGFYERETQYLAKIIYTGGGCAACGTQDNLAAHHVIPWHLCKDHGIDVLDEKNWMPACMKKDRECHLLICHGGNFRLYNPNARKDCAEALAAKDDEAKREHIIARAAGHRVKT